MASLIANFKLDTKAIVVGSMATVFVLLSTQLAYVLLASYVGGSANDYAWVNEIKDLLWFLLSAASFCVSFFIGGVVTAILSRKQACADALAVAISVSALSVLSAGDIHLLNLKTLALTTLCIVCAWYGAYWATRPEG